MFNVFIAVVGSTGWWYWSAIGNKGSSTIVFLLIVDNQNTVDEIVWWVGSDIISKQLLRCSLSPQCSLFVVMPSWTTNPLSATTASWGDSIKCLAKKVGAVFFSSIKSICRRHSRPWCQSNYCVCDNRIRRFGRAHPRSRFRNGTSFSMQIH